ncbi:MAG: substrate-binding domain-containing protein [Bacteroidales bacterium]|nr:substrate-binding domain-containing protein [Bacteroidales bacterium]
MKYHGLLSAIFLSLVILCSCQSNEEKLKVGFLFHDFDVPRWEREKTIFENRMNELGCEVLVKSAGGNEQLQRNQAIELIDQGVELLVVIPVNAKAAEIVRLAHDSGIKVISYEGMIPNCDLDYHIEFDSYKVGELQAEYLLNRVPEGNLIIISADDRRSPFYEGSMNILEKQIANNKVNIIYTGFIEAWSPINAAFFADKILEFCNAKVDGILCVNDGMAGGINSVLKKRGLNKKLPLTGQDADLAACWRIMNDEQCMTVYKPSKLIALSCAEMVFKILKHQNVEGLTLKNNGRKDVPCLYIDPIIVDKSNLQSTIVADDLYTIEEIQNYTEEK